MIGSSVSSGDFPRPAAVAQFFDQSWLSVKGGKAIQKELVQASRPQSGRLP
ncbi:hypothetical protein SynA1825c_00898 [Synechococcus sp. A18-25c]|nr:hypothetical protein SynA1560_00922 [Synechococcus sp. A15-60]QNJ19214.1 hypothetical protein SynA1825c_00898 [Synechococcus sp. A18-25c]